MKNGLSIGDCAGGCKLLIDTTFGDKKNQLEADCEWCALVDSNHRPPPCQGDALTKLS